MKTLLLWGRPAAPAASRLGDGAELVARDEEALASLRAAGFAATLLRERLGADGVERVERVACEWTRAWGRLPLVDGRGFRELLTWEGLSLWWWVELFLFHSTESIQHVRAIETFRCLLERTRPDEVEADGLTPEETLLLARTCVSAGVLFHGDAPRLGRVWRERARSLEARWVGLKSWFTALKAALAGTPPALEPGTGRVLFVSHAAFWRTRRDPVTGEERPYEHYFDRILPAVEASAGLESVSVAVGPHVAHRTRGLGARLREWLRLRPGGQPFTHLNRYASFAVHRRFRHASAEARRLWRRLRRLPALHGAFSHAGVRFDDLSAADLAGMLLLQAPWAVRSFEEMRVALAALKPRVVCLYAEDSGWGRAVEAACWATGIPSVGVQHGILYPNYYSYMHAPDDTACPRPDRTAVFGAAARRFLVAEGRYAPESLVITGSPKFDALLEAAAGIDRGAVRARLAARDDELLLVVASRYRGVRLSFPSIGSALPALIAAAEAHAGTRLVVKPHPAESPAPYAACLREARARRAQVVAASSDLVELLHAADALLTVESLSAIEALVLGRPVVVLNMPTNLRELVERGVALGVGVGEDPGPVLASLREEATLERLRVARARYLPELAAGLDGQATARIVALLRQTAETGRVIG